VNHLQLCQTVQGLLRATTGALATTPTTTTSQTGVEGEIVRFVGYAYRDIQNEQVQWLFRMKRGSFNTVASTRAYTITSSVSDFEALLPSEPEGHDPFITLYLASDGEAGETRCYFVPYLNFRQSFLEFGSRPEGRPVRFTIEPDGQIAFDPTPDAIYTVNFDYRRTLHELTTDADASTGTPIIPSQFHMSIVWGAMKYYALTRDAPQSLQAKWEREYAREMNRLRIDQLPAPKFIDDAP
jgi:hypothetical protein